MSKLRRWEVTYESRVFIAYTATTDQASALIRSYLRDTGIDGGRDDVVLVIRPAPKLDAVNGYEDRRLGGTG